MKRFRPNDSSWQGLFDFLEKIELHEKTFHRFPGNSGKLRHISAKGERIMFEWKKSAGKIYTLPVESIRPSPFQARTVFDEKELAGLAQSIRENGLLQPISVRRVEGGYELWQGSGGSAPASWPGWRPFRPSSRLRRRLRRWVAGKHPRKELNP